MVRSTVNGILPNVFSYISHFVCLYNFNYTGRPLRGPGIIGISLPLNVSLDIRGRKNGGRLDDSYRDRRRRG